jgi:hypothetical protein
MCRTTYSLANRLNQIQTNVTSYADYTFDGRNPRRVCFKDGYYCRCQRNEEQENRWRNKTKIAVQARWPAARCQGAEQPWTWGQRSLPPPNDGLQRRWQQLTACGGADDDGERADSLWWRGGQLLRRMACESGDRGRLGTARDGDG